MTDDERRHVQLCVSLIVHDLRAANPRLVPGEIYDAIAEELERRCRAIIEEAKLHEQRNPLGDPD